MYVLVERPASPSSASAGHLVAVEAHVVAGYRR
jgi:hypothetical protein